MSLDGSAPVCCECSLPVFGTETYAPFCSLECAEIDAARTVEARRAALREDLRGRELAFLEAMPGNVRGRELTLQEMNVWGGGKR